MKRVPLLCLLALLCATSSFAQSAVRSYHFDNFDTESGVRIKDVPLTDSLLLKQARRSSAPAAVRPLVRTTAAKVDIRQPEATAPVDMRTRPRTVSTMLKNFTTGDAEVDTIIAESGKRYGVDPALLYAIMHQESAFKPRAVSNKGARGLMQLMPATAARFGVRDIFNKRQNIEGGARYMRFLLDTFSGSVPLALAGYNAGEGAVMRYGRNIPPYRETQEYVRRITRRYALIRDPQTIEAARVATPTQVPTIQAEPPPPVTTYEQAVYAVRLPNGSLFLVSQ